MSRKYKFHNTDGVYFVSFAGYLNSLKHQKVSVFEKQIINPIELWSNKPIDQKINYLPVRSGGYQPSR